MKWRTVSVIINKKEIYANSWATDRYTISATASTRRLASSIIWQHTAYAQWIHLRNEEHKNEGKKTRHQSPIELWTKQANEREHLMNGKCGRCEAKQDYLMINKSRGTNLNSFLFNSIGLRSNSHSTCKVVNVIRVLFLKIITCYGLWSITFRQSGLRFRTTDTSFDSAMCFGSSKLFVVDPTGRLLKKDINPLSLFLDWETLWTTNPIRWSAMWCVSN